MDDVVRDTRMLGLLQDDRCENEGCLLLIRVSLVLKRSIRDQGQGIKDGSFAVLRIVGVQQLHRSFIPFGADAVTF